MPDWEVSKYRPVAILLPEGRFAVRSATRRVWGVRASSSACSQLRATSTLKFQVSGTSGSEPPS